jgi:hypothetical protein
MPTKSLTDQTLSMFPAMKDLPAKTLRAAACIANGDDPVLLGFREFGSGAYTTAYTNDVYVVKGIAIDEEPNFGDVFTNMDEWFRNTQNARKSALFRRAARKYIVNTVVLFDCVAVQERVATVAQDIDETVGYNHQYHRMWRTLCRSVEALAAQLGIDDMHEANWGFMEDGSIKMFDISPAHAQGATTFSARDELALRYAMDQVVLGAKYVREAGLLR